MSAMRQFTSLAAGLLSAALLGACAGSVEQDKKIDYGTVTLPPLEVPPDLVKPPVDEQMTAPTLTPSGSATYSGYSAQMKDPRINQTSVLPPQQNIKVARAGAQRWLVVKGEPEQVWPAIREFFINNGLSIAKENAEAGIIETEWAENHAHKSFFSTGTRDKFRVRLERGEAAGTTEIYLSHRGMVEIVQGSGNGPIETLWQPRPPDAELEAEMLHLLMVHLGVDNKQAKSLLNGPASAERAKLNRDNQNDPVLIVYDDLERAWRRVGLALDHVGLPVEERDHDKRLYNVRYNLNDDGKNEPGKSGNNKKPEAQQDSARYQIVLRGVPSMTEVRVLAKDGAEAAPGAAGGKTNTSEQILSLLYEQLK
ncbi:MAG TPA: outer membrane protein assembly factor BamC [Acidiferrobacterales bacterium]|nr:outer membrane protein assembly factor BamC [Acidiferrobacterales bacterium]